MIRNKRTSSFPQFNLKTDVLNNARLLDQIQSLLGRTIKLCDLFVAVVTRGGYKRVCDGRLWSDIARELKIPVECGNMGVGLRRIYHQFLVSIEMKEYPVLSENFILSTLSDTDGTSENSYLHTTTVEQNLGIGISVNGNLLHSSGDQLERSSRTTRNSIASVQENQGYLNGDSLLRHKLINQNSVGISNERVLSELRLVELALTSGLPNEIEVALNTLLVLSITPSPSGSSTTIRLAHCLNLLSVLLASIGIYGDSSGSYITCDESWEKQNQLQFFKFWYNIVRDPMGRAFIRSDVFINSELTEDEYDSNETKNIHELFAPISYRSNRIAEDLETSRVLLIATVLINLVTPPVTHFVVNSNNVGDFEEFDDMDDDLDFGPFTSQCLYPHNVPLSPWRENARFLASNPNAIRFLFLCAYSDHSGLKSLGLQLLSTIRYPLDPPMCPLFVDKPPVDWTPFIFNGCRLGQLTLAFLSRCLLESQDRTDLIAGLAFLANLAKVPDRANATSLLDGLSHSIWSRLAQLICLPDLAIVCASLEALRCLTNLGTALCLVCWQSCGANDGDCAPLILLQPLMALLTLEGQSMGSQSLHRIRLMQRNTSVMSNPNVHMQRSPPNMRLSGGPFHLNNHHHQKHIRFRDFSHAQNRSFRSYSRPQVPIQSQLIALGQQQQHHHHHQQQQQQPDQFHPYVNDFTTFAHGFPQPILQQPIPVTSNPRSVSHSFNHSNYRSSSVNMSCTGLINLLSSSNATMSTSETLSDPPSPNMQQSTNLSAFASSSPSPGSPVRLTHSCPSPSPSLSELTDRLQMPPPSLPPPSALRRSAKWSLARAHIPINSPTASKCKTSTTNLICKLGSNSLSNSCPSSEMELDVKPSSAITVSTKHGDHESAPKQDYIIESRPNFDVKHCLDRSQLKGEVAAMEKIAEQEVQQHPSNHVSSNQILVSTCNHISKLENHQNSIQPDQVHENESGNNSNISTTTTTNINNIHQPILNGNIDGESMLEKQSKPNPNHYPRTLNGLKPGLLQTAVKEIHNRKWEYLNQELDENKLEIKKSPIINGLMINNNNRNNDELLTYQYVDKFKNNRAAVKINSPKRDACSPNSEFNAEEKEEENKQNNEVIVNGYMETDDDVSHSQTLDKVNGAIDTCDVGKLESNNLTSIRMLKRRRKWGSRNRLFTPKRRRDYLNNINAWKLRIKSKQGLNPNLSNTISNTTVSDIKLDQVPGSVLAPSWKPALLDVEAKTKKNVINHHHHYYPTCEESSIPESSGAPSELSEVVTHVPKSTSDSIGSESVLEKQSLLPLYFCEWECCTASFQFKQQVTSHVYNDHLLNTDNRQRDEIQKHLLHSRQTCRWRGCQSSTVARAPFALMTHVLDLHCGSRELEVRRLVYHNRKSQDPDEPMCSQSSSSSPSEYGGGIEDQSAWSIIRSVEARNFQAHLWTAHHHFMASNLLCSPTMSPINPSFHLNMVPPPREGPVTKHLRITAALVLRNLVTYLEEARTWLIGESQLLSELAMGCSPNESGLRTNDASSIIAQCLSLCGKVCPDNSSTTPPTHHQQHIFGCIPFNLEITKYSNINRRAYFSQTPELAVDLDSEC